MKQLDLEALIDWDEYFLNQAIQGGHGFYSGTTWQRGYGLGSIFRSLFRFLVPIGKTIGKSVGREALVAGTNIAGDLLEGHELVEALKNRGRESGRLLIDQAKARLAQQQSGSGRKRGRPKGSTTKKKKPKKRVIRSSVKREKLLLSDDIFD